MEVTVVVFKDGSVMERPLVFTDYREPAEALKVLGYKQSDEGGDRYTRGSEVADLYIVQVKGA